MNTRFLAQFICFFSICTPLWAMEQKAAPKASITNQIEPIVRIITQRFDPYRSELVPDGGWFPLTAAQVFALASRYINHTLGRRLLMPPQKETTAIMLSISRELFTDILAVTGNHDLYTLLPPERQIAVLDALNLLRCTNIKEIAPEATTSELDLFGEFADHPSPKEEES